MTPRNSGRLVAALWALAVVALVGGIAAAGLWMQRPRAGTPETVVSTQPTTLLAGRDYYVFVRLVEFNPKNPQGKNWDTGSGSAPDAKVLIFWRGQRVFELPERTDSLIATWDLYRVDVKQLLTNGGKIDVASAVNAPIVRVAPGEAIRIEVYDADTLSPDDQALKIDLPLADLREGQNHITPPIGSGLSRLTVEMIDRETPLSKLIEMASQH
jgi:hypothetical protein